ncbi:hypothetical protein CBR_g2713 [Chara braunii]|uniref:Uncharacterized protein n=1 Tax=Chara braunii TaxID=69332 RepID=A0A388KDM2_CHABU|nr:hypothetical protein CBR_g2713 [Chara braunii]|eukprot:GBG68162.1 hypothetical protein CBR_g2713 [Chara braunii]
MQEAAKQQAERKPVPTRNFELRLKIIGIDKKKTEYKEDEMKKWVTKTFGDSLKLFTEKLDEVDKKFNFAEDEKEELKRLGAEKELQELKEGSSSEKRKKHPSTSVTSARVDKIRVKLVDRTKKDPTRRVLIFSDEEEDDGAELIWKGTVNLTRKFEEA